MRWGISIGNAKGRKMSEPKAAEARIVPEAGGNDAFAAVELTFMEMPDFAPSKKAKQNKDVKRGLVEG